MKTNDVVAAVSNRRLKNKTAKPLMICSHATRHDDQEIDATTA